MKLNLTMWKDILTEKVGTAKLYSQARVYLLFSVIAYYITLGLVTAKSLKPTMTVEMDSIKIIIDALQWAILLFCSYAFGGKVIDGVKTILGKTTTQDITTQVNNNDTSTT